MQEKDLKQKKLIKVLLIGLILAQRKVYKFMKYMNANKSLFKVGLEQKTAIIPCSEIADVLGLENDEECDKMATTLLNLAYNEKEVDKLDEKIDKFMKRYEVFDGK